MQRLFTNEDQLKNIFNFLAPMKVSQPFIKNKTMRQFKLRLKSFNTLIRKEFKKKLPSNLYHITYSDVKHDATKNTLPTVEYLF